MDVYDCLALERNDRRYSLVLSPEYLKADYREQRRTA